MFTPLQTIFGALLLHQSTSVLLFYNGTILGASGLLRSFLDHRAVHSSFFLSGVGLSFVSIRTWWPDVSPQYPVFDLGWKTVFFALATGFMTGWGTKCCNGCTSGHMLCGLSRLSGRSLVATSIFFPTAVATFQLIHPSWYNQVAYPGSALNLSYIPHWPSTSSVVGLGLLTVSTILACNTAPRLLFRRISSHACRLSTYFCAGYAFGLGLLLSGMASPFTVSGFFNFSLNPLNFANWDPSLGLVFLFGVIPNFLWIKFRGFNKPPLFCTEFSLPKKTVKDIDARFIAGALAFGASWGLSGTCPGPAMLRTFAQPLWGLLWMTAFWAGGLAMTC